MRVQPVVSTTLSNSLENNLKAILSQIKKGTIEQLDNVRVANLLKRAEHSHKELAHEIREVLDK